MSISAIDSCFCIKPTAKWTLAALSTSESGRVRQGTFNLSSRWLDVGWEQINNKQHSAGK